MPDIQFDHAASDKPTSLARLTSEAWEVPKQEKEKSYFLDYATIVAGTVTAVTAAALLKKPELMFQAERLLDRIVERVGGGTRAKSLGDAAGLTALPDRVAELKGGISDWTEGKLADKAYKPDLGLVLEDGKVGYRPRSSFSLIDGLPGPGRSSDVPLKRNLSWWIGADGHGAKGRELSGNDAAFSARLDGDVDRGAGKFPIFRPDPLIDWFNDRGVPVGVGRLNNSKRSSFYGGPRLSTDEQSGLYGGPRPSSDGQISLYGGARPSADEQIKQIKALTDQADVPIKGHVDPTSEHFIPVKASLWDLMSLTAKGERAASGAEKVADIKRYVNAQGQPAHEYLASVMKSNDITIIGEQHTLVPNYHRIAAVDAVKELPAGSTLAVEMPKSLDGVFERFNESPGVDLETVVIPSKFGDLLSQQHALSILSVLKTHHQDMVDLWKSARDNGVRVVPIDVELNDPLARSAGEGAYRGSGGSRETQLASELVALHRADPSKPVVAWLGSLHGAKSSRPFGHESAAELIAREPEFASGEKRLSTVFSQLTEENLNAPPSALAEKLKSPVGIPVSKEGQGSALAQVRVLDRQSSIDTTVGDYDHFVMYPRMPLAIKIQL